MGIRAQGPEFLDLRGLGAATGEANNSPETSQDNTDDVGEAGPTGDSEEEEGRGGEAVEETRAGVEAT